MSNSNQPQKQGQGPSSRPFRAGIVGIERQLEKQARETEKNISEAFQDLNSLIDMAKPMVQLVTTISNKLKVKRKESSFLVLVNV